MNLSATTVVVFDVLRASTSMISGLEAGATEIFPVNSVEEARERKRKEPEILLAGERGGCRSMDSILVIRRTSLRKQPGAK
jgi:2-phosphosulfolactate phosphatase